MRPTHMESDLIVLGSTAARLADRQERDQQKWNAILRPIALEIMKWRMILSPNRSHFGGSCAWERNLPDISVVEIPVDEEERPLPPPEPGAKNALLDGPILRTLLWLAWPNVIALSAGTCVVIAETSYIGRLGVESLAAMALVFPFVILTMTMSGGAMGGGVASAVARALGAGDVERASTLAAHALLIGICFGLTFMLGMLMFGPALLELLGGRGNVLANAVGYAQIFFGGAVLPWLMNTMAGVLRGTGNMKLPSLMILSSAICQIILGGTLGLGLGPIPQFGMRGVAAGSLIAYSLSHTGMGWVPVFRAGARRSQDQGTSYPARDVLRHPQGRRGLLFLAAAGGAHHQHLHPYAGGFRHRDPGRLRHWRAARIHADLGCICDRHCVGADDRDGDRSGTDRPRAADCVGRWPRFLRLGRRDRQFDRDVSGSLGQYLYPRSGRASGEPAVSGDGGTDVRVHWAGDVDVFFLAGGGQGGRSGAGAKRAAAVHRARRLVAVDA